MNDPEPRCKISKTITEHTQLGKLIERSVTVTGETLKDTLETFKEVWEN